MRSYRSSGSYVVIASAVLAVCAGLTSCVSDGPPPLDEAASGSGSPTADAASGPGAEGGALCEPQSRRCEGKTLKKCAPDGMTYADEEVCSDDCDAARAQCSSCKVGAVRCNGKRLEQCNGAGTSFELQTECGAAELCDEPGGQCLVCPVADSLVCVGLDSHRCNADRKGTTLATKCGSLGCDPSTSACVKCNPSMAQCAASEFCDAPNCLTLGLCVPRPSTSTLTQAVACGCDGVTYWNKQHANFNGKTTNAPGFCGNGAEPCNPATLAGCGAGEYCNVQHNTMTAVCGGTPGNPPVHSLCMNKPVGVTCGSGSDMTGAYSCGGGCLNSCQAFSGSEYLYSENCF